ncbi:hypothetical protein [Arthrobacter sp. PAMC25564]|uniref:hypothetical protein n=1 Tax=Arthrobacter sp. PAMC25564 TaxID=2565366 RepID=UPI00197B6222|nr:hypothetical protein [Arthrobacter sp. PAMC25564]
MVEKVPQAFLAFFDDAAVFPPGLAPLDQAIADHVARRRTPLAAAVGPVVLPLAELAMARELAAGQDLSAGPVLVSVVTPAGRLSATLEAGAVAGPALRIIAVELKTSPEQADWERELAEAAAAAESGVQIYVELTASQIDAGALELIAGTGVRLKYRTGGIEDHLFPTPALLAATMAAATARRIPFKLTAGLHQAVRHTNEATGFTHHGFLNIAVAAALAQRGCDARQLEDALLETDSQKLTARFRSLSPAGPASPGWRRDFISFGTCSVAEPAESLEELGLLPAGIAPSHTTHAHTRQEANPA